MTRTKASLLLLIFTLAAPAALAAQHTHHDNVMLDSAQMTGAADAAMSGPMSTNAMRHMKLSPPRSATHDDSVRALAVVQELRAALSKYADTATAVADGFRMFMPNVKQQRVFHFTNYRNAFRAAYRFDPAQPTSILYERDADGHLKLVGAMYTAPRRMSVDRLDERVPLSVARWHQHVNWCVPPRGEGKRWLDRENGMPVFGPESPIATREACDSVGGQFHPAIFGWMVHANVFAGDDPSLIFAHGH